MGPHFGAQRRQLLAQPRHHFRFLVVQLIVLGEIDGGFDQGTLTLQAIRPRGVKGRQRSVELM